MDLKDLQQRRSSIAAIDPNGLGRRDALGALLLHLCTAPKQGIPLAELPTHLRDADVLTVCFADGLIELGRRRHCLVGPDETPHVEPGWEFGRAVGPGYKPAERVLADALAFDGDARLRPHVRLTSEGRTRVARLRLAQSQRAEVGGGAAPGTDSGHRRRLTDADRKHRRAVVRNYIRKERSRGTPIESITRDAIAKATGIPGGAVSATSAWKALAAEKAGGKKPRRVQANPVDLDAAIEAEDWSHVLAAQNREARSGE